VHFNKYSVVLRALTSFERRECPETISDKPDGFLVLLLGQRDRDVAAEALALPLVAGGLVEGDVDGVPLGLAGREGTEVPAGRELCDGRERRDAADPHLQLVVVDGRSRRGVAEVAAEGDDGVDGTGVGDAELLLLRLARLQVVEVEVDRGAVVLVADAELEGRGVDVDACRVGVGEGRSRGNGHADEDEGERTGSEDGGDGLVATTGSGGVRGHLCPLSTAGAASGISEMGGTCHFG
jgi:hypothetical protein